MLALPLPGVAAGVLARLFFICLNRDPHRQFVPMQLALSNRDVMMECGDHAWAYGLGVCVTKPKSQAT